MLEECVSVLLPKMGKQLGVGGGAEVVAFPLELSALLGVVKQLAIEDHPDGAVLVGDRLLAVAEADNAQSSVGEVQAVVAEEAVLIRAAVVERGRHRRHGALRRRASTRQIHPS